MCLNLMTSSLNGSNSNRNAHSKSEAIISPENIPRPIIIWNDHCVIVHLCYGSMIDFPLARKMEKKRRVCLSEKVAKIGLCILSSCIFLQIVISNKSEVLPIMMFNSRVITHLTNVDSEGQIRHFGKG